MLKTLLRHVGRYRAASLLTPLFTVMEVVMDVLIPWVVAHLIDEGVSAGNMAAVYRYGLIMIGMAVLSLMFGILSGRFSAYASSGFAANLRGALFRSVQGFAFSDIDRYQPSGLITRITTDVQRLQQAFQIVIRIAVRAPFRLVLSIAMCLMINTRISLIFVVALLVLGTGLTYILKRTMPMWTRVMESYDSLNQRVEENVSGMRVVKAFVREEHESTLFAKIAEQLCRLTIKADTLTITMYPLMNMVVYGSIIALSWWGAHFVVDGTLTTGELTSMFTYVMGILSSLMMLSMIFVRLTSAAASGKRVVEILNTEPAISSPESALTTVANGRIEMRGVKFKYREEGSGASDNPGNANAAQADYALNDITLSIATGERIGIIGGTGSGKSTLVSLIPRLHDATEGSVLVGGEDVRRYDLTALRSAVSQVLQANQLFTGTILSNLRWGKSDATLDECRRACHIACADEFIDAMPEGYNAAVEQGGANLSGGQRQRLCIARALLKKPKILILDDSTSACDATTDATIRRRLSEEMTGTTLLLISQRVSSVRDCDRILVLEAGRMAGFGTHDELMAGCELYHDLATLQASEGGDFDEKK